jgi:8-amino-7-oxononanoate synthase
MAFEFITQALAQQSKASLLRSRSINCRGINFSANDYLGLSTHPELIAAWQRGASRYGVGSGGSFLVTGYTHAHAQLEEKLASITGYESCLLFNSGYSANQALVKSLLTKNDLLLQDKLNHASLIEAGIFSPAVMKRFKHNDAEHLDDLLKKYRAEYANALVVTEGIFSMDGDQADLATIARLAKANDAWLLVDDAHGFGVLSNGAGSLKYQQQTTADVALYIATFGKALGVSGAFVAGSKAVVEYLVNFSKPYIYSTAMPAAMAVCIDKALDVIASETWRFEKLNSNIAYFRNQCQHRNIILLPSYSPIQPLIIGDPSKAIKVSEVLAIKGFLVKAIRPPTVPQGTARLRITLSASHSFQDIDLLLAALQEALYA